MGCVDVIKVKDLVRGRLFWIKLDEQSADESSDAENLSQLWSEKKAQSQKQGQREA